MPRIVSQFEAETGDGRDFQIDDGVEYCDFSLIHIGQGCSRCGVVYVPMI